MLRAPIRTILLFSFLLAGLFPVVGSLIGWWRSTQARADLLQSVQLEETGKTLLLRQVDHLNWLRAAGEFQSDETMTQLDVVKDGHACAFGKWYYGPGSKTLTELSPKAREHWLAIESPHLELHATAAELEKLLRQGKEGRTAALQLYRSRTCALSKQLLAQFTELRGDLEDVSKAQETKAIAAARRFEALAIGSTLVVLVLAPGIGWTLSRRIDRRLRAVAELLSDSGDHAASAANQVSASSLSLAEGASHQASSMEETSASLEQVSAMTENNARDATKASDCARQARQAADRGVVDMEAMTGAMEQIKASSDEIAKIIRTIDNIAFQTNILALNAAVEAARAGDAGLGFAVVANEVRNLAQRSSQAARETDDMISVALAKTSQGVEISHRVGAGLQEIVERVRQADELAAAVSTASREQSQGISQVTTAVREMDGVTQANAATAEESASAAEELSAQAGALRNALAELRIIIDGSQSNRSCQVGSASPQPPPPARNGVVLSPKAATTLAHHN